MLFLTDSNEWELKIPYSYHVDCLRPLIDRVEYGRSRTNKWIGYALLSSNASSSNGLDDGTIALLLPPFAIDSVLSRLLSITYP